MKSSKTTSLFPLEKVFIVGVIGISEESRQRSNER
jgi:hypothetical protein